MGDSRRRFVAAAAALGAAALSASAGPVRAAAPELPRGPRLRMPPLIDTAKSGRFELTAVAGDTAFAGGQATRTLGFNQPYLGPTVRLRRGEVAATVRNALDETMTVHWHGLLVPGDADGGPHQPIAPGARWAPVLEIDQAPATAFYHSHQHRRTAAQVYAGLAGILQVDDGRDDARGLPRFYGVDDLTLVIQDRRFDSVGRMIYRPSMMDRMHGFAGDVLLVNGQIGAVAAVPRGVARLRLVNASNARPYRLYANDGRPLHLVATDGGYLPAPLALERVQLAPGERVELLIDFGDARPVVLMSGDGPGRGYPVMSFAVDPTAPARITRMPGRLDGAPARVDGPVATERWLSLDMGMGGMMGGMMGRGMGGAFGINGRAFDMQRIDLQARRGSVEHWRVRSTMLPHPFHVHGASFQVVSENGGAPLPEHSGWKDTVLVDGEAELRVRFDKPAAADRPYMFHCHILEHEDGGMMGQFTVA